MFKRPWVVGYLGRYGICSTHTHASFYLLSEPFFQLFLGATRGIDNITVGDDTKAAVSRGDTLMDWKDTQGTTSG